MTPRLSKSRIQSGRQCHKRLWLELHEPSASNWTPAAQARLDEGTRFGELAHELLGGGVLVAADHLHVQEALGETVALLARPHTEVPMVFEAAFSHQDVRVRVDGFQRHADHDVLIEVKSTTSVKEEHLWDCAIQTWVARGAGRNVARVLHGHVDNSFVYRTEGDFRGLLKLVDITDEVERRLTQIPQLVEQLKRIAASSVPDIRTGAHCTNPYSCPFFEHCKKSEPAGPEFPIDTLPRAGKALIERLNASGWEDLRQVPLSELASPVHRRVAEVTRSGVTYFSEDFKDVLDGIAYPRYYLDFETIGFVVPRWISHRPFEQIPFQFSCHVETSEGHVRHEEFLDTSGNSPVNGFVDALIHAVGNDGPILVWNRGFEGARVRALAERFPGHAPALSAIVARMLDLLPIYRDHYYHKDMRGSWSIKAVLPTIAPDLDYGDLEVGDGSAAQEAFMRACDPGTPVEDRLRVRQSLLKYCERDTWAMVRLTRTDALS